MLENRTRRLAWLVALALLALPTTAAGKEGAILDPQLLTLPSGHPTRAQLSILPVYRNGPFGPSEMIPAPAAGSLPVVTLSMPGGQPMLRFTGTPLNRQGHSVVWITLPASIAPQRRKVVVRSGGHVYPDPIDSAAGQSKAPAAAVSHPAAARHQPAQISPASARRAQRGASRAWPFLLGGLALAAAAWGVALKRVRRVGRMLPRGARR